MTRPKRAGLTAQVKESNGHLRRRHVERANGVRPEELAAAERSLQLHWLQAFPAYRAQIRERVSEAAKQAEIRAARIDRGHADVDYLGRDVEGCG